MVLTGICLGSWKGSKRETLPDLVKEVDAVPGDFRVRLSSIEPNHINAELIEVVAHSTKICQHFHIPLQSGSDRILSLMKRRYNTRQFRKLITDIRRKMPLAGITMDIIVAFPGETEEDFACTAEFIEEIQPSRLHVFRYSDREGTVSQGMTPKIKPDIGKKRVKHLINLGSVLQERFSKLFIGRDCEMLAEEKIENSFLTGYTREYVQVKVPADLFNPGDLICVKLTGDNLVSREL